MVFARNKWSKGNSGLKLSLSPGDNLLLYTLLMRPDAFVQWLNYIFGKHDDAINIYSSPVLMEMSSRVFSILNSLSDLELISAYN